MRIADADVAELRRLRAEGMSQKRLALRFGISQSAVSRLLAGERRPAAAPPKAGATSATVERYLAGRELVGRDDVLAAGARFLALKIDTVSVSEAVGAAQAAPGLVRSLIDVLSMLDGPEDLTAAEEQLERMLAPLKARPAA